MPTIEFHALNVSSDPHPPGVYRRIFEQAAGRRVRYFGEKVGAISKPSDTKDGVFYGFIMTWTEIDKNQPVIDTILLDKPTEEKLGKLSIPENIGFNWQAFYYAFREKDHVMVFESRNADNARLGASNAERMMRSIFDADSLFEKANEAPRPRKISVDLIIQKDALDKIFALERLNTLEIHVSAANSDDNTSDTDELLHRLKRIHAQQTTIYKSDGSEGGIRKDEVIDTQSAAALQGHGYVRGVGYNGSEKVYVDSKSYPKKETVYIGPHSSAIDSAIRMAREFFFRPAEPKTN